MVTYFIEFSMCSFAFLKCIVDVLHRPFGVSLCSNSHRFLQLKSSSSEKSTSLCRTICRSCLLCLCLSVYVPLCVSVSLCQCLSLCVCVSLYLCLYVSVSLCVCASLCLCSSVLFRFLSFRVVSFRFVSFRSFVRSLVRSLARSLVRLCCFVSFRFFGV